MVDPEPIPGTLGGNPGTRPWSCEAATLPTALLHIILLIINILFLQWKIAKKSNYICVFFQASWTGILDLRNLISLHIIALVKCIISLILWSLLFLRWYSWLAVKVTAAIHLVQTLSSPSALFLSNHLKVHASVAARTPPNWKQCVCGVLVVLE